MGASKLGCALFIENYMQKILFNDRYGLTNAVLRREKWHTRRKTPKELPDAIRCGYDRFEIVGGKELRCWNDKTNSFIKFKLPYQVGEIVAVAQAYKDAGVNFLHEEDDEFGCYDFPAHQTKGWNNKMFVRADLMPHQVRITRVWIERLQDISDEDCIKEGIIQFGEYAPTPHLYAFFDFKKRCHCYFDTPREAYATLIDKVSGKGSWDSNPLVFCYEFELVK